MCGYCNIVGSSYTCTLILILYREALLSVAKTFFESVDLGEESIKVCYLACVCTRYSDLDIKVVDSSG